MEIRMHEPPVHEAKAEGGGRPDEDADVQRNGGVERTASEKAVENMMRAQLAELARKTALMRRLKDGR